jgi:uncharacterized caspase-like protein
MFSKEQILSRFRGLIVCLFIGAVILSVFLGTGSERLVAKTEPFSTSGARMSNRVLTASNWQVEIIDASTGDVYFGSSLALESGGRPCVAYYDPGGADLVYACRDTTWQPVTVDSAGDVGQYTSLVLDASDHPHISYQDGLDGSNQHLKYAHNDGSGWASTTVDGGLYTGAFTSIALDNAGDPWITYYRGGNCSVAGDTYCNLRYANYYDGGWSTTRLHYSTNDVGRSSSLAFDSEGHAHISYYNAGDGDLRYIHLDWSVWDIADGVGTVGADTSLAIDSYEDPHIAYVGEGSLRYAHGSFSGTEITWVTETVESGTSVRAASLALDTDDHPHISYYLNNNTLRYAYHDGTRWHIETVASTGNITGREGTSLALDSTDSAHISFYTTSGLKYAYRDTYRVYLPLAMHGYPPPSERYALIIGVADYLHDEDSPDWCFLGDLPYPDDDARAMEQLLLNQGGFEASNVRTLIDSDATRANIEDAITNWLASRAALNDQVVIFYHGHGGQLGDESPYGDEADGVDEWILPHDYDCYNETAISDDQLDTWLDTVNSQHIVLFFDCCFSGGLSGASTAGEEGYRCRCLPPPPWVEVRPTIGSVQPMDVGQNGRLVLMASEEDDSSYECDSLQSGVFSYYLRQALQSSGADTHDLNGWISGEEAYDYLKPRVEAEMCYQPWFQFPQINDGTSGEEDVTQP